MDPEKKPIQKEGREERDGILSLMSSKYFILVVLLLAGIVWYGFYWVHPHELAGSDDREYASVARNVVNGKGIVKNFVYPVDINFFNKMPIPELGHPVGYPLLLAAFFKVVGIKDFVALLPSYLSYFAIILLFFFYVRKYVDARVAALGAVLLVFNRQILDLSLVALAEPVYTVILFLFFFLIIKADSLKKIFVAGIVFGLSNLFRENTYPFLLASLIYLYFYPELPRWKKMALFVVGLLIPAIPFLVIRFVETGSPFFSYGKFLLMLYSDKYPWENSYRFVDPPSLAEFLLETPGILLSKYSGNFTKYLHEGVMSFSNPFLLAFFFVDIFYWKITPEQKKGKKLLLLLLGAQLLFVPLIQFNLRYFNPFLPIIMIFASQSIVRISDEFLSQFKVRWKKATLCLAVFFFLLLFALPTLYVILRPERSALFNFKTPQYNLLIPKEEAERINDFLRAELKENQVVWTDLPEILEWEGNRLCGWLPMRIEMIHEVHKTFPVDAILLTSLRMPDRMGEEWTYLLMSELSLPRFRTMKLYRSKTIFAKLLIRDEQE